MNEVVAGSRRWAVIQGDCQDALRRVPGAVADAVICDPPFGVS
jgi:predicted methyltransferase